MKQVEMLCDEKIEDLPSNLVTKWYLNHHDLEMLLRGQKMAITDGKNMLTIEYLHEGEKLNGDPLECVKRKIGGMSKEELVKLLEIVEGVVKR